MAESTIITGQFVRISQVPASLGERILVSSIIFCCLSTFLPLLMYWGNSIYTLFPEVLFSCCSCLSICPYYVTRYFAKFLTKDKVSEKRS